jgi:hypothetical protein
MLDPGFLRSSPPKEDRLPCAGSALAAGLDLTGIPKKTPAANHRQRRAVCHGNSVLAESPAPFGRNFSRAGIVIPRHKPFRPFPIHIQQNKRKINLVF